MFALSITKCMWVKLNSEIRDLSYKRFWELYPGEQEAVLDRGYKSKCWGSIATESRPWFKCICRDMNCHSRDKFLGVKFFHPE